ncbi:protein FAM170A-like [Trichechus manatus latirostris]|uniref:Protein FAM170A-like n=1 Tax=Trichechus manatus latirostris TaxID=127582 RepID=A0A2Y9RZB7_TRIMA|nr:protein FAM170A-like [Trichechus manatus latirostris]
MSLSKTRRSRKLTLFSEVSTQEENAQELTISQTKSLRSRPRKIPQQSESSFPSASTEQTSHSSSYGAAPEKRWVRCTYFTQVRTVKGVAVAWRTKTSFAPVGKMPQVFEAKLSEDSTIGSAPSLAYIKSLVSALEPWQERPETHTPEPSVWGEEHGERSRAATQEWLVTRELTKHGVSQGFSCHVFCEELLERWQLPSAQCRPQCCHQLARCHLTAAKKREVSEKRTVCRHLEEQQLEKQREELKRLRHQLAQLQGQEARLQRALAWPQGQMGKHLKTC